MMMSHWYLERWIFGTIEWAKGIDAAETDYLETETSPDKNYVATVAYSGHKIVASVAVVTCSFEFGSRVQYASVHAGSAGAVFLEQFGSAEVGWI